MTTFEIVFGICVAVLILLIFGNLAFSKLAERNNPPIGSFLECNGVRLHYLDCGDAKGPCVVLFHGNGSMMQDFMISGLVTLLARNNRVVCFDRPGFGHSQRPRSRVFTAAAQADLFAEALHQLGVRNPVVLGHSWGSLVAIALALRKDCSVRGLVLASGYYFPTWRWDVWIMAGPAIPLLGDLVRYTVAPIISWAILPSAYRKLFAPRTVPREFESQFPASLTVRPKQLRAAAEESAFLVPTATQFRLLYAGIQCPVHIFHGVADEIIEVDQARHLHQGLPSSELHVTQDAGHMVTYSVPDAIAQAVDKIAAHTVGAHGLRAGRADLTDGVRLQKRTKRP